MNGPHDLGGAMGFGPINPEPNEPVFHETWEGRMFALSFSFRGTKETIDASRHRHENTPPANYLASSYYQIWLGSFERRLLAGAVVTAAELSSGHSAIPGVNVDGILRAFDVAASVATRRVYTRPAKVAAAFAVGDRVRTRNMHPTGHTRLPRYARGHYGTIERINGYMVFPDSNAHGRGEDPHWCYSASFSGSELWGVGTDPNLSVSLDLWEPYLEAA
jgi:nitrile hydratase subunit beta